jgi:hypothetical protein
MRIYIVVILLYNKARVAAEPSSVCAWPIVSREKDKMYWPLLQVAVCREILYQPYVYECVPFFM